MDKEKKVLVTITGLPGSFVMFETTMLGALTLMHADNDKATGKKPGSNPEFAAGIKDMVAFNIQDGEEVRKLLEDKWEKTQDFLRKRRA